MKFMLTAGLWVIKLFTSNSRICVFCQHPWKSNRLACELLSKIKITYLSKSSTPSFTSLVFCSVWSAFKSWVLIKLKHWVLTVALVIFTSRMLCLLFLCSYTLILYWKFPCFRLCVSPAPSPMSLTLIFSSYKPGSNIWLFFWLLALFSSLFAC